MTASNPPTPTRTIPRTELLWLAGAVVFGAVLRLSFPSRMAIEHFDEGVYASNFWLGGYPYQYLYAPPLLPAAIEWTMVIASLCGIKPTGFIPIIPCLIAGIATIPSIWWIGRRWFGPSAGLTSAWLVATSDFHACYSRAALTDVPVCLFILWAVYFIWQAMVKGASCIDQTVDRRKSKSSSPGIPLPWRDIILAGVFTGLAWWTKYNGWLPLAIGFAGGCLWQLLTTSTERQIRRTFICWILIAAIASLVWSPVLWSLQKEGGYASVAANHRQYVVGVKGWSNSALKQFEHVGMYENWIGMFTEGSVIPARRNALNHGYHDTTLITMLGGVMMFGGEIVSGGINARTLAPLAAELGYLQNYCATFLVPLTLLIVACLAIGLRLRMTSIVSTRVAACLLAAWLGGMTVATPFYYPYPRLVLPWLTATWLGVGLAVQLWRNRVLTIPDRIPVESVRPWSASRIEWILVVWLLTNCLSRSAQGTAHALRDRTTLAVVAEQLTIKIDEKLNVRGAARNALVYVWGEPALVFGLKSNGLANVVCVAGLDVIAKHPSLPTFVVFGKQALDSPSFPATRHKLDQCELCDIQRFQASHLVEMDSQNTENFYARDSSLDKKSPHAIFGVNGPTIWLYRIVQ